MCVTHIMLLIDCSSLLVSGRYSHELYDIINYHQTTQKINKITDVHVWAHI